MTFYKEYPNNELLESVSRKKVIFACALDPHAPSTSSLLQPIHFRSINEAEHRRQYRHIKAIPREISDWKLSSLLSLHKHFDYKSIYWAVSKITRPCFYTRGGIGLNTSIWRESCFIGDVAIEESAQTAAVAPQRNWLALSTDIVFPFAKWTGLCSANEYPSWQVAAAHSPHKEASCERREWSRVLP